MFFVTLCIQKTPCILREDTEKIARSKLLFFRVVIIKKSSTIVYVAKKHYLCTQIGVLCQLLNF